MAGESKLQTKIIDYLKDEGWDVNKRIVMSHNGYEDLECYRYPATAMFIEVKDAKKTPDPLQAYWMKRHTQMGFVSFFANSFEMFLTEYKKHF
jgi:hypothetical protein